MPASMPRRWSKALGGRRPTVLALILALQALAAVFFLGHVLADITVDGIDLHLVLEAAVAIALILGVVFGALEMRRTLEAVGRSETALSAARGAMIGLIETRFADWGLTPAEREVRLLALKGFDVAAISRFRGAATGTVRAQLARIYAKAAVSSRTELLSVFMDDLIAGPVDETPPDSGSAHEPAAL